MPVRIVVVGGFNMDLTTYVPRMPRPGETILGERFVMSWGGKGSNQAIAAARLGAQVTFVGRVGRDSFGEAALQVWQESGVDKRHVVIDSDRATGVAPIWVDSAGENMIVVASGANSALHAADVDAVFEAIREADVMVTGLEIPLATAAYALRLAKSQGVCTILNPAPACMLPDAMLADVDFLTPNETELSVLAGAVADETEELARCLLNGPSRAVIVTMGAGGASYFTGGESGHVSAFPVHVLDSTGAGDAFTAGLAVALGEGMALADAVRFGSATAGACVTRLGAAVSMPDRAAVETLLKRSSAGLLLRTTPRGA